jgi:LuxR family transcriptional regulator, maltose regulon positive regulatory protein
VRLWLTCGEIKHAISWAQELEQREQRERISSPFAREREEVAHVRLLLAQAKPGEALQKLQGLLAGAQTTERWDHFIEMKLLQAVAHQMHNAEQAALGALAEAIHLAEPEGYIRSFVDEGPAMMTLLSRLREQQRRQGPTPYLDSLLAAF